MVISTYGGDRPLWDPAETIGIINKDPGYNRMTCMGTILSGRRCRNPINQSKRQNINSALESMSLLEPSHRKIASSLEQISFQAFCHHHVGQAPDMLKRWSSAVKIGGDKMNRAKTGFGEAASQKAGFRDWDSRTHAESDFASCRTPKVKVEFRPSSLETDSTAKLSQDLEACRRKMNKLEKEKLELEAENLKLKQQEEQRTKQIYEMEMDNFMLQWNLNSVKQELKRKQEAEERERARNAEEERERERLAEEEREEQRKREAEAEKERRRQGMKEKAAQRERQRKEREEEEKLFWNDLWKNYQAKWDAFREDPVKNGSLRTSIPWPVKSGLYEDVTEANVKIFFWSIPDPEGGMASRRRNECRNWHPDGLSRLASEICEEERLKMRIIFTVVEGLK